MEQFLQELDPSADSDYYFPTFDPATGEFGTHPDLDPPSFSSLPQTQPSETQNLNASPPATIVTSEDDGEVIGATETTFIGGVHNHAADRTDVPSAIEDLHMSDSMVEETNKKKRDKLALLRLESLSKARQLTLLDLQRDLHKQGVTSRLPGSSIKPLRPAELHDETDDEDEILRKKKQNQLLLEIHANDIEEYRLNNVGGRPNKAQEISWKIREFELLVAQDDLEIFLFQLKQANSLDNRHTGAGVQTESVRCPGEPAIDQPSRVFTGVPFVESAPNQIPPVVPGPQFGTNLLASWNEQASLAVSSLSENNSLLSRGDRSNSHTSASRSVSPATSEGIHQAVASSIFFGVVAAKPVPVLPLSLPQTSTGKYTSASQQATLSSATSRTVATCSLPPGVPAKSYICWELPDPMKVPASANRKRKRTPEEVDNLKAVRAINACVRCRRLKIKCSGTNPCSGCIGVLKEATKTNPTNDLCLTACVRTLLSFNFFVNDGSLPNAAEFPDAGSITAGNLQEAFRFSFHNLFANNRAPVNSAVMEKLDDLYIKALVRAFPRQTCVAKISSTLAPSGLNIFIKSNTVLILENLFPEEVVAEVKPSLESLRALSSVYLFEILIDATSPARLRSANSEQAINIIVVLALVAEQILDLYDLHDRIRWSDSERDLQNRIVTEMVKHLRYLILKLFRSKSRVLKFVDLKKRQLLLDNAFWPTLGNETLKMVSMQQQYGEQMRSELLLDPVEEEENNNPTQPPPPAANMRSEQVDEETMTETVQDSLVQSQSDRRNERQGDVPVPSVQKPSESSAKSSKKNHFGRMFTRWDHSISTTASKVRDIKDAVKASAAHELYGIRDRISKSRQRREYESRVRREIRDSLPLGERIVETAFPIRALRALAARRDPDLDSWNNDVPLGHLDVSSEPTTYRDMDFS